MILSVRREISYGRYYRKLFDHHHVVDDPVSQTTDARNQEYLRAHPPVAGETLATTIINLDPLQLAHYLHYYPIAEEIVRRVIQLTNHPVGGEHQAFTAAEQQRMGFGSHLSLYHHARSLLYKLSYQGVIPLMMKIDRLTPVRLLHEYVIGSTLNQLRPLTPHFMYVYDYVPLFPPLPLTPLVDIGFIDDRPSHLIPALFTEYIGGITLHEFIPTCSVDNFIALTLQIMYSLELAQHHYRFVHNDLHSHNIIITDRYPETRTLTYQRPQRDRRQLVSRYTATIIDYDLAALTIEGVRHGTSVLKYHLVPTFNPLGDVNRFIYGVASHANNSGNYPLVRLLYEMWQLLYVEQSYPEFIKSFSSLHRYYYVIQEPVTDDPEVFSSFLDRLEARWSVNTMVETEADSPSLSSLLADLRLSAPPAPVTLYDGYYLSVTQNDRSLRHSLLAAPSIGPAVEELRRHIINHLAIYQNHYRCHLLPLDSSGQSLDEDNYLRTYLQVIDGIKNIFTAIKVLSFYCPASGQAMERDVNEFVNQIINLAAVPLTEIDDRYRHTDTPHRSLFMNEYYPLIREAIIDE